MSQDRRGRHCFALLLETIHSHIAVDTILIPIQIPFIKCNVGCNGYTFWLLQVIACV